MSIENLCFVIKKLLSERPKSGIFNVADDTTISTSKLVEVIAGAIDQKSKIWNIPKILISLFAKVGTFLRLPFNENNLQKLTEDYVVENSKIKEALQIELPVSTIAGLESTLKTFE